MITLKGKHLPAATTWVRTERDVRQYLRERAADIFVPLQGRSIALAELPMVVRQMFEVRFLEIWKRDGWLPYTRQDVADAQAKAEAYAREAGGDPVVGVQTGTGKPAND